MAGIAIGLIGAAGLTRVMASLLFGIGERDVATFTAVPVFLGVVALVACYIPALRATRVDPMIALRAPHSSYGCSFRVAFPAGPL